MSRYIDADALIPETVEVLEYGGDDGRRLYSKRIQVYSKKQIDEAPTADVRENKFAKWKFKIINGKAVRECSHCGWYQSTVFPDYQGQIYNFCPCCGFFTGTSWKQLFKGGQDEQIR